MRTGLGQRLRRRRGSLQIVAGLEQRTLLSAALTQSVFPGLGNVQSGFGNAVATDGNILVVGAPQDNTGATDSGAAYVFNATTGALLATLANPTPANNDHFGVSVSVSGNTVVVGADFDDTGATDSGAAYVFNATTGALLATLANPTPANYDNFGKSVSVSGNTVVVGANGDNTAGALSGSAYVFNATTGALLVTLANPTPANYDNFGKSVSVSGNTVVVGAISDDTGGTDSGTAYVFNATTGALLATLANPTPAPVDLFGDSVSVSGNTVVVGAFLDDTGATNSGAAYVFNATTGALLATLANPTPAEGDSFGYSVSVLGNKVVVGAYGDDTDAPGSGAAYVFNATTGALLTTLANPTHANGDLFGYSVAVSGNTVVVGAFGDDTVATDSGAAYLFTLQNEAPVLTGDGAFHVLENTTLVTTVVGTDPESDALTYTLSGVDAGLFTINPSTGALAFALAPNYESPQDANRNNVYELTVGVSDGVNPAVTKAFTVTITDVVEALEFVDPHPAAGNAFGAQVIPLSTGNVVVTSPFDDAGGTDAGAVYLFNGATGALISTLTGSHSNDNVGRRGVTALPNGNFVVLSYDWDNGGVTNAGAVTWGSGTTGVTGVISAENSLVGSAASDEVGANGITVLSNGNYVVVSSEWDNGGVTNAGAVTWGDGAAGVKGVINATNSLVGNTAFDRVGVAGISVLANGNYVVRSYIWDNGGATDAGAVTWGDGTVGVKGVVSAANSLVGSPSGDHIGIVGVTALTNGNYVVNSNHWHNAGATNAGAVTWGDGTVGVKGVVNTTNSLVGTAENHIGNGGTIALPNGNYVVVSSEWDNGGVANAGAVTWGSGTAGVTGLVSAANSLVGSTASDFVGANGITVLSNGNYVVRSDAWDNGGATDAGAVTWGDGTAGVKGVVSAANSLVGSTASDFVGMGGVWALTNGNYIVRSATWDN